MSTKANKTDKDKKGARSSLFEVADDAEVLVFDQSKYGRRTTERKAKVSAPDHASTAASLTDADE